MKIKKNGKVINLTESDLKRIVKKVMSEQMTGTPLAPGLVDPKHMENCCKSAGIEVPESCKEGDYIQCMADIGKMITNDPMGMGIKAVEALSCLKEKLGSPVMY